MLGLQIWWTHLYADLDGLPVSALGVWDALGHVHAVVNHRVLVPGLLLQGEDDAPDVHVAARRQFVFTAGSEATGHTPEGRASAARDGAGRPPLPF